MADILVQCPRTGAPVPTGLKTEWVLLKSLPCVAVPLRCPACGQMHKWKPDDAWIGSARQSSDANLLSASRASLLAAWAPPPKTITWILWTNIVAATNARNAEG